MPGAGGIHTARQAREADKSVAVLFIANMAQYDASAFRAGAADRAIKPMGMINPNPSPPGGQRSDYHGSPRIDEKAALLQPLRRSGLASSG